MEASLGTADLKAKRITVTPREGTFAKCVSPCDGTWGLDQLPRIPRLAERLAVEFEGHDADHAFVLRTGLSSERVAERDEDWETTTLPGRRVLVHFGRSASAIRMKLGDAVLALHDGRPLVLVRCREFILAGIFTSRLMEELAKYFNSSGYALRDANVYGFFGAPKSRIDHQQQLRDAAAQAGFVRVDYRSSLPVEGPFCYRAHSQNLTYNLCFLHLTR